MRKLLSVLQPIQRKLENKLYGAGILNVQMTKLISFTLGVVGQLNLHRTGQNLHLNRKNYLALLLVTYNVQSCKTAPKQGKTRIR